MYGDEELLPLSGLQHLSFCPRQCALIHQEQTWVDNSLTVEGSRMHERADEGDVDLRGDLLTVRALPVRSKRLGLAGRCDVVEFRRTDGPHGAVLQGRKGRWIPRPVEYKRGRPKGHRADEVQLCAQGICLEETFGVGVARGDVFYGQRKRRSEVVFDRTLRALTEELAREFHELLSRETPPRPEYEPRKCESCSLVSVCLPRAPRSTAAYLAKEVDY
jgi:CRISPR-associated exonuclease Cas4